MEYSEDDTGTKKFMGKKPLDLRVFYVRLSSCSRNKTPHFLSLRLLPREYSVGLEVNGEHFSPSETVPSMLRRDRIDEEREEATYVSTDSIRTTGPLKFGILYKDVLLVCEKLEMDFVKGKELRWRMDCYAALGLLDRELLRGNHELWSWIVLAPVMEVYVAGCALGSPVILTKRLQLLCRTKSGGRLCLDAEDREKQWEKIEDMYPLFQLINSSDNEDDEEVWPTLSDFNQGDDYIEHEGREISWFSAGVSVGVAIGLGMCLAIGVGVGLIVRTYRATTKNRQE